MRRRWRTVLGAVLIVLGAVGLGVPLVSFVAASPGDVLLDGADLSSGGVQAFGSDRLVIPEVGISMPLFTGDLNESLERGAWLAGSRPGEPGNTVIFGHRYKYLPPLQNTMFRLDGLEVGDTFTVRWQGEDRLYRVGEKRVVAPTQVSVAGDFGDERVTLITCHPVWSTRERLVVVGFPVEH